MCAIVAELAATAGMSLIDWESEWAESGTAMAVGMIVAAVIAIIALLVIKKNAEKGCGELRCVRLRSTA